MVGPRAAQSQLLEATRRECSAGAPARTRMPLRTGAVGQRQGKRARKKNGRPGCLRAKVEKRANQAGGQSAEAGDSGHDIFRKQV